MKRRSFITLLGGATAWPLAARAQQAAQIKRVGMLMGFANDALGQVSVKAFQQELERLGWAEGRSVAFEFRWRRDVASDLPISQPSSSGSGWTSS